MGFLISNYSLQGLQPQSFYVSIQGNFMINKNTGAYGEPAGLNMPGLTTPFYTVSFTVYYSAAGTEGQRGLPVTQKQMIFNIQELPEPADIYFVIYNHIKKNINPDDIHTITDDDS